MVTLTILAAIIIVAVIIAVFMLALFGTIGAAVLIPVIDVIICIALVVFIVKTLVTKRKIK